MHANYSRSFDAELHYRVLRHVDLAGDRASIYDPDTPETDWARQLREAYGQSSAAMLVQVLPLVALHEPGADVETLLDVLRDRSPDDIETTRRLCELLQRAYDDLEPQLREDWQSSIDLDAVAEEIDGTLGRLRRKLWSKVSKDPPPLTVLDVAALESNDGWTHGRAVSADETRTVAVSLDVPPERALVQLLHEEVHPLTDPVVRAEHGDAEDITTAIETTAIDVGAAVVEAAAPELTDLYDEWRTRFD